MTGKIYVHTIGNSIIDNLPYLLNEGTPIEEAKNNSVEGQLQTQLDELDSSQEKKYEVVSHAYAGFNVASVLVGDTIGKKILPGRVSNDYARAKVIDTDFVKPLEILKAKISESPQAKHFVVIGFSHHVEPHYLEIVDRVKRMGGKPILIIPNLSPATSPIYTKVGIIGGFIALVSAVCLAYLARFVMHIVMNKVNLHSRSTIFAIIAVLILLSQLPITYRIAQGQHPGMAMAKIAVQRLSKPILAYAKKDKLTMIDLPNTFDPYQTELYCSSGAFSKQGGALIAKAICHAIARDESNDSSYIYTDKGRSINNPREWYIEA